MRRAKRYIFDIALLVLELVDCLKPCPGRRHISRETIKDLPPQNVLPLFRDEALFGIADIAQDQVEFCAIELTGCGPQFRIGLNMVCDIRLGETEAHLACALVESGLGNHLAKHQPIKPACVCAAGR